MPNATTPAARVNVLYAGEGELGRGCLPRKGVVEGPRVARCPGRGHASPRGTDDHDPGHADLRRRPGASLRLGLVYARAQAARRMAALASSELPGCLDCDRQSTVAVTGKGVAAIFDILFGGLAQKAWPKPGSSERVAPSTSAGLDTRLQIACRSRTSLACRFFSVVLYWLISDSEPRSVRTSTWRAENAGQAGRQAGAHATQTRGHTPDARGHVEVPLPLGRVLCRACCSANRALRLKRRVSEYRTELAESQELN